MFKTRKLKNKAIKSTKELKRVWFTSFAFFCPQICHHRHHKFCLILLRLCLPSFCCFVPTRFVCVCVCVRACVCVCICWYERKRQITLFSCLGFIQIHQQWEKLLTPLYRGLCKSENEKLQLNHILHTVMATAVINVSRQHGFYRWGFCVFPKT